MTTQAPPKTRRSTRTSTRPAERRNLRDLARHVRVPAGAVTSGWPAVRQKAGDLGLGVDDWQDDLGKIALSKRASGQYAAGIGGVVWSIPRQVGKTYLVALIIFALCLLNPGTTVLWTAHRLKTASETFGKLQAFTRRKKIRPHILKVTTGSGEQVVYFRNGSRILFGARERGFGRGFDNVDIEVFDEAQILTAAAIEDMIPAVNVSDNPLVFFIGTPPRPTDPGEVFAQKRKDALAGDPDTAYIEFGADDGADEMDRKQWAKANPSYPKRTNDASMLRMKKMLNTPGSFRREALGIWDANNISAVYSWSRWSKLATAAPPTSGNRVLAVKFSIDGARISASAAIRPDLTSDLVHVECIGVAPMSDGTAWLADKIAASWRSYACIVVDGKSGAGDFANALRAKKVPAHRIITPTTDQVITAHSGFLRAILDSTLTHLGQRGLDAQIKTAARRKIGAAGGWGVEPSTPGGDVVALESAIFAHWGAMTTKRRTSGEGRSGSSRRGVVS